MPDHKYNMINEKYMCPYDNLLYAILLQAAKDSRKHWYKEECKRFLETTGKSIYNYLSKRPQHRQGYCFEDNGYLSEVQKSYRLNKAHYVNELRKANELLREVMPILRMASFANYKDTNAANELYDRIKKAVVVGAE